MKRSPKKSFWYLVVGFELRNEWAGLTRRQAALPRLPVMRRQDHEHGFPIRPSLRSIGGHIGLPRMEALKFLDFPTRSSLNPFWPKLLGNDLGQHRKKSWPHSPSGSFD
jgi:hypothetical protein